MKKITQQEKKDKILEAVKKIPLEKWEDDNYYKTEINGLKVKTYYRPSGAPPAVEVDGEMIWGTKIEDTSGIFWSVDKYFKDKKTEAIEQKLNSIYDKLFDS